MLSDDFSTVSGSDPVGIDELEKYSIGAPILCFWVLHSFTASMIFFRGKRIHFVPKKIITEKIEYSRWIIIGTVASTKAIHQANVLRSEIIEEVLEWDFSHEIDNTSDKDEGYHTKDHHK